MRIFAALACIALATACAPTPTPGPGRGLSGEDTCGMARNAHLIGVHEDDIDRASLPPLTRIICPTCLVTQDYSPTRLNLHTSTEGRVASMRCG